MDESGSGEIMVSGETSPRVLRVITLEDGETVHNPSSTDDSSEKVMKLHYYPETDSLYIELVGRAGAETKEVSDGVNVDLDDGGKIVGFDIDRASAVVDLSSLEATALPLRSYQIG